MTCRSRNFCIFSLRLLLVYSEVLENNMLFQEKNCILDSRRLLLVHSQVPEDVICRSRNLWILDSFRFSRLLLLHPEALSFKLLFKI